MGIKKYIYKLGVKVQRPRLFEEYAFLKRTEKWSIEQLKALQLNKLRHQLRTAYDQTVYYKNLFDRMHMLPEEIDCLDKLSLLPIINKRFVINHLDEMTNIHAGKSYYAETSGSTGEALCLDRNEKWDTSARAAQLRGYSWYGVNPWEKNGYFWGYSNHFAKTCKVRLMDGLMNRFRLFSYQEEEIIAFANKLCKAVYIEGYASMIYEVAKVINRLKLGPYHLKMVKGTSEQIYDYYQDEVQKAFGQKMISEYGSMETGLIAYECTYGRQHIIMENVIVEEIKGEAVITNLNSFSVPLIRYQLGDGIVLDRSSHCPCGMQHTCIGEISGRVGKLIYGKEDSYPGLTLYYIFKNYTRTYGHMWNYQAVQTVPGKLTINLEQEIDEENKHRILEECRRYFHDDIEVAICSKALKRDYTKKFCDFISDLH
ncbi:MAG TPA: capsule biosynthesis protein CapK [Clostridiales bacterium]|jgi:phenylacetate-CoA ligase|nr:capsule biosynthesis protein CapK [Clostridiales bacterium]